MYIILAACPSTAYAEDQDGPMSALYNWKEAVENLCEEDIRMCFVNEDVFSKSSLGAGFVEQLYRMKDIQIRLDKRHSRCKIIMQHNHMCLLEYSFSYKYYDTIDQYEYTTTTFGSYYLLKDNGQWKLYEPATWRGYTYGDSLVENKVYVKKTENVDLITGDVVQDDHFYSTDVLSLDYEAGTIYALENTAFGDKFARVSGYPILERGNGDLLITTKNTSQYTLRKVSNIQYCYPAVIKEMYTSGGLYWSDSYMPVEMPGRQGFVEINGVEVDHYEDLAQLLQPMGITASPLNEFFFSGKVLMSDTPAELTMGYYSGTKFCEETIHLDHSVYTLGERFTCPVQRTKYGYFIVDTSSLEPGYYVIEDGFNWYALNFIEITN